jgi:hypothetical protein
MLGIYHCGTTLPMILPMHILPWMHIALLQTNRLDDALHLLFWPSWLAVLSTMTLCCTLIPPPSHLCLAWLNIELVCRFFTNYFCFSNQSFLSFELLFHDSMFYTGMIPFIWFIFCLIRWPSHAILLDMLTWLQHEYSTALCSFFPTPIFKLVSLPLPILANQFDHCKAMLWPKGDGFAGL